MSTTRSWWMWGLVLAGALLIRFVYLLEIKDSVVFSVLVSDGFYYDQMAQAIAAGNWLGGDAFHQAPLYPYFLALVYAVFGHDLVVLRSLQFILGALSCLLVALAARDFSTSRAGLVAGGLLAVYAPALFYEGLVQKVVLDGFLMSLLLAVLGRVSRDGRARWLLATGLALALLTLNRSNAIGLAVLVVVWILVRFRHDPAPHRWAQVGWFGLGLGVVFLPVAARNQAVAGDWLLTAEQAGPLFYMGNNAQADGTYQPLGRRGGTEDRRDWEEAAERAAGRELAPAEVNAFWRQRAVRFIRDQPRRWLQLLARKCLLVWNAREITDSEDPAVYADASRLLNRLQRLFHFGTIAPVAAVGVWMGWRDRRRLWLLYGILVVVAGSVALFFVSGRYRYPLVPVLILFAGTGLGAAWDTARGQPWRRCWPLIVVIALSAVLVNWRLLPGDTPRVVTYHNLAVTLAESGRYEDAIHYYRKALEIRPDFVPARVNLANLLARHAHPDPQAP